PTDVRALLGFRHLMDETFDEDFALDAIVSESNTRGHDARFAPEKILDNRRDTYWATDDGVTNADIVMSFKQPVTFNLIRLREFLPLGQRVEAFVIDQWKDGGWVACADGTSIGNCRIV